MLSRFLIIRPFPGIFCAGDSSYDMQDFKVTLSPNPPKIGENVTISATGTLSKLYVHSLVNHTLISERAV